MTRMKPSKTQSEARKKLLREVGGIAKLSAKRIREIEREWGATEATRRNVSRAR